MRALVVGYGSMGRRRIRILKKILVDVEIVCVDSQDERFNQAKTDGFITYSSLEEALRQTYDCAFICTSPGCHADLILKMIENRIHVFTEINLVDDKYDEIINSAQKNNIKVFMSSTLLYNRQVQEIKKAINKTSKSLNYIYHVGQYLPDWHPWESYKNYFISKEKTNGCREILAIQLPWMVDCFGEIKQCTKFMKKSTNLDINYKDTYYLQILHKNDSFGTFICDVVSRQATTYLEIFNEDIHIKWDGTPTGLYFWDFASKNMKLVECKEIVEHIEGYASNVIENEYEYEINAFLGWINLDVKPLYQLEDDKYIISIINEIEANG